MSEFVEKVRYYYQDCYFNCSEAIIRAANDYYGLQISDDDLKMFGSYGGGMFSGYICGVICAGVAVLGKMIIQENARREQSEVRPLFQKLTRRFKEELGGISCPELKPKYFSKETACWTTVKLGAEILEKTIEEIRKEKNIG